MRAQEFLDVMQSEGIDAVQSYTEDDLAEIDEPRLAAAALAAFWALACLSNTIEDLAPAAPTSDDEEEG